MIRKLARKNLKIILGIYISALSFSAFSEDSAADLAKKLSNPVAALISVPIQANYDEKLGPNNDGKKYTVNIQPVIPFSIGEDWNIISRTILPITSQTHVLPGTNTNQDGVGDVLQSVFFSPKAPTENGWIWGAGPVLLLPTASDKYLGAEKWGVGPTVVVLKQSKGWTYGVLANHVSSFAGEDARDDISSTFVQPFLSFTTKTYTTFGVNTESTYDWKGEQWSVPLNFTVAQLFKVGNQPQQITFGLRYWANDATNGPEDWGVRVVYTLLFPK